MQPVAPMQDVEMFSEAQGLSSSQIYDKTLQWMAENFKSSKAVIEYQDKQAGTIIGHGSSSIFCSGMECLIYSEVPFSFTLRVDIKDGKTRTTYKDITLNYPYIPPHSGVMATPARSTNQLNQEQKMKVDIKLKDIVRRMNESVNSIKNSNW